MATNKKDLLYPIPELEAEVLPVHKTNDLNAKCEEHSRSPGRLPAASHHNCNNIANNGPAALHADDVKMDKNGTCNHVDKSSKHEHFDDKTIKLNDTSTLRASPKKYNTNNLSPSIPRSNSTSQKERVTFKDQVNICNSSTNSSNSLNSNGSHSSNDNHMNANIHAESPRESVNEDQDPVIQWECDHIGETVYRGGWSVERDFTISALGYVVGLGNVWRFPYLCYRNGGGAFLVPYFLFVLIAGIPLVFLELSFGQFAGVGVISAWKVLPIFKGIGYGMVTISFLVGIYYNAILAWTLYYLFASMQSPLPWASCDNHWNTDSCCKYFTRVPCLSLNVTNLPNMTCLVCRDSNSSYYVPVSERNFTMLNIEQLNRTIIPGFDAKFNFPAEEYFYNEVIDLSDSITTLGAVRWELALCLLLSWFLVWLALLKGVKVTGKLVYFTVFAPYFLMLIILIRASMLDGASTGIVFYLHPDWQRLLDVEVWHDAASQVFFTMSISYGGLMTLASYNHFNHNCYKDSLLLCLLNSVSSIFAGFPAFCTLGYMATQVEVPVSEVVSSGSGLMFVAYPEAITHLPYASWWSVAFFLVLYTIGFDSQLVLVTTVITSLTDQFPRQLYAHRTLVLVLVCSGMYLLGLPLVSQGGLYLIEILDKYASSWGVLYFALLQCIGLCWIYGYPRLSQDICLMLGKRPGRWWRFMWQFVTPFTIVLLLVAEQFKARRFEAENYEHASGKLMYISGWVVTGIMLIWVPAYAIYLLATTPGSFTKRWLKCVRPAKDWGACGSEVDAESDIPDYIRSEKEEYIKRLSMAHNLGIDNPALSLEDTLAALDPQVLHDYEDILGIHTGDDIDTGSIIWSEEENKERGNWTGRYDFLMSGLAYTIGIGNVWRFPYLVYKNGGGAFFVPYFLMVIFCGLPLFYLELAFGQFASTGPLSIWKVSPIFKGVGYCAVITVLLISLYYNVINAWSIYYLFASMQSVLPWQHCNNSWNTPNCYERSMFSSYNCSGNVSHPWNDTFINTTIVPTSGTTVTTRNCTWETEGFVTPSEEYFFYKMLKLTSSPDELGTLQWELALCLLMAWSITFLSLIKGVKSVGKIVYVTVGFPYIILMVLLIRYVTLGGQGHLNGIKYFVTPQWDKLGSAQVWGDAASQLFFSLGLCMGSLIALSSYNRFHYDCYRDAYLICLIDTITSIFAGFVVFTILGVMADETGSDVESVIEDKFTLAYVVYPEAVTQLPAAPVWSILFFIMLFCLAIDSQFLMVQGVIIALDDEFGQYIPEKKKIWLIFAICLGLFILGLPLTTQGGLYGLVILDWYVASLSPLFVGILMCVALGWVYGVDYFCSNVRAMLGNEPNLWWRVIWRFVTPTILLFILIFSWAQYSPPSVHGVLLAGWPEGIGLFLALLPVLAIPIGGIVQWCLVEAGDFKLTWQIVSAPREGWGPALKKYQESAYAPGADQLHTPDLTTIWVLTEQSIFATEASGMLGLVTSKNKKKNKQPKESKADRRQKITKKWKAIADKSIQSESRQKLEEEGALMICPRAPPVLTSDMATQTDEFVFAQPPLPGTNLNRGLLTASNASLHSLHSDLPEGSISDCGDSQITAQDFSITDEPPDQAPEEVETQIQSSAVQEPFDIHSSIAQVTIL